MNWMLHWKRLIKFRITKKHAIKNNCKTPRVQRSKYFCSIQKHLLNSSTEQILVTRKSHLKESFSKYAAKHLGLNAKAFLVTSDLCLTWREKEEEIIWCYNTYHTRKGCSCLLWVAPTGSLQGKQQLVFFFSEMEATLHKDFRHLHSGKNKATK